jgi:hypothetical protein
VADATLPQRRTGEAQDGEPDALTVGVRIARDTSRTLDDERAQEPPDARRALLGIDRRTGSRSSRPIDCDGELGTPCLVNRRTAAARDGAARGADDLHRVHDDGAVLVDDRPRAPVDRAQALDRRRRPARAPARCR